MSIKTEECKKAIVEYCRQNSKEIFTKAFGDISTMKNEDGTQATIEQETAPMLLEKNWKREEKRIIQTGFYNGLTERAFDCRPYDSQIRAYVIDDGEKIIRLFVQGE